MAQAVPKRSIWVDPDDQNIIQTIDQRYLPHELRIFDITTVEDAEFAIAEMVVRGAPLIGVTAAYGIYLAALNTSEDDFQREILNKAEKLVAARPTAVNLKWAVDVQLDIVKKYNSKDKLIEALFECASKLADEDAAACKSIGRHGLRLIEDIYRQKRSAVNILTHCNAGWLACVEWGTATAPIYLAHEKGIPIHVWVDETRPRIQGALTSWELMQKNIPHSIITDNAGGLLMQQGKVDICITGTDRTTYTGDVANKIGTYLKALAAKDNDIPFYVALPSSTIDWNISEGKNIPIEERSADEIHFIQGKDDQIRKVRVTPEGASAVNFGFDITPARMVTGLITERGICAASEKGIADLFPERIKLIHGHGAG